MSLLTPVKVPVKVYRWDDEGAPALDKTPNCMATIFKACLVTGYGTKESAGWTMPFEDTAAGVKVLRPQPNPYTDFCLRLSTDTGTEIKAQVYLSMTDANTGELKLQCDTPFKYGKSNTSIKWILIATTFGFWFLCEHSYGGTGANKGKRGVYFTVQHTQGSDQQDAIALLHTGGNSDINYSSSVTGIYSVNGLVNTTSDFYTSPAVFSSTGVHKVTVPPFSIANGSQDLTKDDVFAPLLIVADRVLYKLNGMFVSTAPQLSSNYDTLNSVSENGDVREFVAHATGTFSNNMFFIASDFWSV